MADGFGLLLEREAPRGVIGQLREIDSKADLLYWGRGRWLAGVWTTPDQRRHEAMGVIIEQRNRMKEGTRRAMSTALGWAQFHGFAMVNQEPQLVEQEDFGPVIEDFQLRTYNWLNRYHDSVTEALDYIDDQKDADERAAVMLDKIESESRSDHAIIFRGRVSNRRRGR